jgi:hypothetical protein
VIASMARRAAVLLLLALVLDPPITDWWRFAAWMAGLLAVATAPPPRSWRRLGRAAAACGVLLAAQHLVPTLHIEEAHHYFRPDAAAPMRDFLPPPVLRALEEQSRERYPPEYWCDAEADGCWRAAAPSSAPFAFSADAVFRERRYSRVVSAIGFRGLGELRAGFTNRGGTNWWDRVSDIRRRDMPFYVMYELPARAAGSRLCWRGHVFWEGAGGYEDLRADHETCRDVSPADAGRRVFGLSVLDQPLSMRLQPAPGLARTAALRRFLALAGVVAVSALALAPRAKRGLLALALAAFAAFSYGTDVLSAFARYDPLGGGGDGLAFESMAHGMLESAERGQVAEVLKGEEPSFYFQPGMRYFRAVEKVLFGETSLGYLAVMLLLPAVLLVFVRVLLPRVPALALWSLFFLPLAATARFWWDARGYLDLARAGLAEPLAATLWFGGAALMLRALLRDPATRGREAAAGSLALALACVTRQNLLISSLVLLLLAGVRLWRAGGWRVVWPVWLAFAPFLWVPIHNLVFAGRLELTAQMGPAHLTPPEVYADALGDLFTTDPGGGTAWQQVAAHTARWVDSPARAAALASSLLGLLFVRWLPVPHVGLILAVVGQLPVVLFWAPQGRYSHMAWQLIFVSAMANLVFLGSVAVARARAATGPGLLRRRLPALTAKSVAAGLAFLLLGLLLLELGLRLVRPDLETTEVVMPGERPYFVVRPDSLGFRGGELPARAGCLSLVTMGGGATESARLPEGESWPGRLQSALSGAFPCLQVTNAGREGFSTFGVHRLLVELVLPNRPAVVLVMAGQDDLGRERATPAERASLWPLRWRHALVRHSALASAWLAPDVERRNLAPGRLAVELTELVQADIDRRQAQETLVRHQQTHVPAYRARLEEIVLHARARGAEPVLLTQPVLYGDGVDPDTQVDLRNVGVEATDGLHGGLAWRILEQYNQAARDLGRKHRVQVIDVALQLPKRSRFFADFVNLSTEGAREAAAIISREICPPMARRFSAQTQAPCPADAVP